VRKGQQPPWIVSDELWARIEPLLRLHESLLAELNAAGQLDWPRAVVDGSHLRAMKGGPKLDRARSTVPELARDTI